MVGARNMPQEGCTSQSASVSAGSKLREAGMTCRAPRAT